MAVVARFGGTGCGGLHLPAEKFAVQTYTYTGTMLYNRSGVGSPQYQQPELQSIVGLAKSQPVLEAAAKKLPDHPPAGSLVGGLQTEAVMGSSTLQFTMRGPEAEGTRLTLDAIMKSLTEQAGALRKQTVANILAAQELHAAKAAAAVEAAAENLRKFNAAHQIVLSVDDDLERVRDDIAAVETALETQRSARSSPEEQLQRRRNILQEQQEAERAQLEREAALLLKKNELERAERLHAKRYISDAEFNRIETEYKTLQAQNTAAFEHRRQRLKQLGEALSAHLNRPAGDREARKTKPTQRPPPVFKHSLRNAARRSIASTHCVRRPTNFIMRSSPRRPKSNVRRRRSLRFRNWPRPSITI